MNQTSIERIRAYKDRIFDLADKIDALANQAYHRHKAYELSKTNIDKHITKKAA